ncbi:MAG: DEAD/DEAH box helicase [Planctomycetes bacterium]|nr:DEAD/DEAH box helicase [Planctomycetota bacterium]
MLDEPLTQLPGLGQKRAAILGARLGLTRVRDLLEVVPRGYVAPTRRFALGAELRDGAVHAIEGRVVQRTARRGARGVHVTELLLELADGIRIRTALFNQPWIARSAEVGSPLRLSGTAVAGRFWKLEKARLLEADDGPEARGTLRPRYPQLAGVPRRALRRWIGVALEEIADEAVPSAVPPALEAQLALPSRAAALRALHAPSDEREAERARRRLALEELCRLRKRIALPSRAAQAVAALRIDEKLEARIRRRLPFRPTADQERAMAAVRADLARTTPMARLLVGDVGTGKTAVALYALLGAIGCGRQGLLLAPTEALARQHFETAQLWLRGSRVKCALLIGGGARGERRAASRGELDLVVGTHALLSCARFRRAGVLVIDEQHRFGTRQKSRLHELTGGAHVLSMSATPIPRTWVHALWGSLEVSWLEVRPPGRQPVETRVFSRSERPRAMEELRGALAREGRGLWICPRVRRGEEGAAAAVESARERLAEELPGRRLAALHGGAGAERIAEVVRAFRAGELDLLVASSLIEVGMDFPVATFLVIEDADRFGLVQLHQMRGRIGRGQREARAILLAKSDEPVERLRFLEQESEGRNVAARDLVERGPGEVLGLRQHGWKKGRFFAGRKDLDLLEAVSKATFPSSASLSQPTTGADLRAATSAAAAAPEADRSSGFCAGS